jgi:hypothetical protein
MVVTNDEEVTGSQKFFVVIFSAFGRYVTNLRGTENVKMSKINPPYSTGTLSLARHEIVNPSFSIAHLRAETKSNNFSSSFQFYFNSLQSLC